jgi:hypothetical protein
MCSAPQSLRCLWVRVLIGKWENFARACAYGPTRSEQPVQILCSTRNLPFPQTASESERTEQ